MNTYKKIMFLLPIFLLAQACVFGGTKTSGAIYKSFDAGENWEILNKLAITEEGEDETFGAVNATAIEIDKQDTNKIYVAVAGSGLLFSDNRGESWKKILSGTEAVDVKINPEDSDEIFVGGRTSGIAKAFRSQDGGETWIEVFSESRGNTFVSAVEFLPYSPSEVLLGLSSGEILKSSNSGLSWDLLSDLDGRILMIEADNSQGNVYHALSQSKGLYRTVDGGRNWSIISKSVKTKNYFNFENLNSNKSVFYLASDKGLYRSMNVGGDWQNISLPSHQSSTAVSAVTVNQKDTSEIYAVIGKILYKSSDSGNTWQTRNLPGSGWVRNLIIDSNESNVMFITSGSPLND